MKKIIVTSAFVITFVVYAIYQSMGFSAPMNLATNTNATTSTNSSSSTKTLQPITTDNKNTTPTTVVKNVNTTSGPTPKKNPVVTPAPTPTPTPIPVPIAQKNKYADGTFTGSVADAYFGNIQVQAVIQNGQIVDVVFLQYPNDRGTSIRKNQMAMPILKSEAISSQSANVDMVSGATDSSQAFVQSMNSALSQALN